MRRDIGPTGRTPLGLTQALEIGACGETIVLEFLAPLQRLSASWVFAPKRPSPFVG